MMFIIFDGVDSTSDVVNSTNENGTITLTNSDDASYTFSTYDKTYEELATEINNASGMTASMAQNTSGKYQMVVSISGGSSTLSQSNSTLNYTEDTATAYGSEAKTISYTDITKIY